MLYVFSLWLGKLLLSVSTSTACLKENPWDVTVILQLHLGKEGKQELRKQLANILVLF